MKMNRSFFALFFAVLASAGCRVPEHIPRLAERSLFDVVLIIETDPPEARVFADNIREMGRAPVREKWQFEKLTWSNGKTDFRMLPEGITFKPGEEISIELVATAKGYAETTRTISFPFSGRKETVVRGLVLEEIK